MAEPQRIAQIVHVKADCLEEYIKIHSPIPKAIEDTIKSSNIIDYSIFHEPRTNLLIATFKYVGQDLSKDMARMRRDPATLEWWKVTDAMQTSCNTASTGSTDTENSWWTSIPEVFRQE